MKPLGDLLAGFCEMFPEWIAIDVIAPCGFLPVHPRFSFPENQWQKCYQGPIINNFYNQVKNG
jgi:hypothetical protein